MGCILFAPVSYRFISRDIPETVLLVGLLHLKYGIWTAFLPAELIHPRTVLAALQGLVGYMVTGGKTCLPIQVVRVYSQNSIAGTSASG